MKRALVTGSSGFVGRHIAAALEADGYELDGIDLIPGRYTTFVGDLRRCILDPAGMPPTYDLVVHCAATVGGRMGIEYRRLELLADDLSLDALFFDWALHARHSRVVYFSSSAAYPVAFQRGEGGVSGGGDPIKLTEHHLDIEYPMLPDATYGWTKLTGERLAAEANAAGIPTHVFRPFSGYGTDQDLDYPFPSFIQRARDHRDPFEVWGAGDAVRDWIHIDDIVGAVLAHIDAGITDPVNICTGRATSFDELAVMTMDAAGYEAPIKHLDDKPVGVTYRVGDPSRLCEVYTPRIPIEEGIERALAGQ